MHAGLDRRSQGRRSGWRASRQAFPLGWERSECRLRRKAKGKRTSGLERIEKVRQVSAGKADVTASVMRSMVPGTLWPRSQRSCLIESWKESRPALTDGLGLNLPRMLLRKKGAVDQRLMSETQVLNEWFCMSRLATKSSTSLVMSSIISQARIQLPLRSLCNTCVSGFGRFRVHSYPCASW